MKRQGTLVLIATLLAMLVSFAPAQVQPVEAQTELFFSEYIEGSSYNKALEIYNGTGTAVDLAAGGYSVLMSFNGGTSTYTINLTGSVADGDVYVVGPTNAPSPIILAQADQLQGTSWFNGDDAVALRKGTTIIDVIGQIGFDPGTEWGTLLVSTADNTLRRKADICAGDTDGSNVFDPSIEWDGFAPDTFDGLGSHTANCVVVEDYAPTVSNTSPGDGATQVALDSNLEITFSEPVNTSGDWSDLICDVSGEHVAAISGGPSTFTLDPAEGFSPGETCMLTVYGANINDQDMIDPPDLMEENFSLVFTAYFDICTTTYTPIYQIQGSGLSAAITGTVTTQGVVVGDFEGSARLSGFYMQDLSGDSDTATSDGIFVYTGSNNFVASGQVVRVTGYARERFNQTALNGSNSNSAVVPATNIINCGTSSIQPIEVNLPFEDLTDPEKYEGMLVKFPQPLVISEYFNYDRYGEIVLGLPIDKQSRLFTPTSVVEPGTPAIDLAYLNSLRRITLDDVTSAQNPAVLRHPNGNPFSLINLFRGGDQVQNAVGVLGYDFSLYRIMPTGPADYTAINPRPSEPTDVNGRIQIAAMNTLNFFLTLDYPTGDSLDNKCGPLLNMECRGADSDQPDEFNRQRTKLLQALYGLDAAVIGLNEIENTTGVEPLADIVAGLNVLYGYDAYAYIDTDTIGTDAIKVGLIYRTADVTPVGMYQILDSTVDPRFLDTKNRPTLVQTFEENSTGSRFTVAVNHLKSKGSDCSDVGDPDLGDGAGNCNVTRTLAAEALVDWLATDPTGSGDPDFIIMGDLNSYAMEDPIDAIKVGPDDMPDTADDYTNLISDYQGMYAYSYVFDGQNGYLDHALANAGMAAQVTGVTDWHINADEPDVLDYDTSFKPPAQDALYEPNQYRTSDHDAVIVGLELINLPPTVDTIDTYATMVNTPVTVSAVGFDLEGKDLIYAWDLDNDGTFETPGQDVPFVMPMTGIYPIAVQVTDIGGLTAIDTAVVAVYDPSGLFVTGGGWINAPDGKGEFSFDAKYTKKNPLPVASVTYLIENTGLYFFSTSYEWLVVDQGSAWLRGVGNFNGMDGYTFLLSTEDGDINLGGDGLDRFRIQIWDASSMSVYNSEQDASVYAIPITLLGGGSITVH